MVEMKVYGLALEEGSQVPVLVLKDMDEVQALPIWIGAMEAMAISLVLNDVKLPRPMTHDLLLNMVRGLGAAIDRVEVVRLENGTYFAEVVLVVGGKEKRVDSRPSDAVALALRAECPILVADEILEEVAGDVSGQQHAVIKTDDADKWKDLLDQLSEDDSKYKM